MATLQELEAALVNADRAGDTAAARILAQEVQNARTLAGTPWAKYAPRSQVIDQPAPNLLERVGHGATNFSAMMQQRTLPAPLAKEVTKQVDEANAIYQRGRGADANTFDLPSMVGEVIPSLPITGGLSAAATALKVANPIAKTAVGALQGAIQGAATYTPEGESTLKQVGLGAVGGAVAPWASDAIGAVVSKTVQLGKGAAARLAASPDKIVAELEPVLRQQGRSWGDLEPDIQRGMLAQARRQLWVDGDLSPDALARKVEMEGLMGPGAGPTRGQVFREDPSQWTFERNNQKLPGEISAPLTQRFQAQIQRLQALAEEAKAKAGGTAQNAYQAGASTKAALQQKLDDSQKAVGDLYKVWRESGGGGTEVSAQHLADTLGRVSDEWGVENIPGPVLRRLNEFGMAGGKQTKLLTIDEAEKLRKLIGNNDPGRGTPASGALAQIRSALDRSVLETETPEVPMLQAARRAAADRFGMRDSSAAIVSASKDEAPDRFFNKYVLNGNVEDLRGLKNALNTTVMGDKPTSGIVGYEPGGAQAWRDLKSQVIDYASQEAQRAGEGSFSGKAFRKALDEVGDERLKVLFEPAELADLRKLDRVAYNLTAEPNLAAVNHSNTAGAAVQYGGQLASAAGRLAEVTTGIPLIGKMAVGAWHSGDKYAAEAEMRKRVSQALLGEAFSPEAAQQKYRQLAELIAGKTNPYAAAGLGGAAAGFDGTPPWR